MEILEMRSLISGLPQGRMNDICQMGLLSSFLSNLTVWLVSMKYSFHL